MPPKRKNMRRSKSVIEPAEGPKTKENYKDAKDHKEAKDYKDTKDNDINPKTKEKEHTDYKIVDGKSVKDGIKDFGDHKLIKEKEGKEIKEYDKWIGEGIPVGLGGPVEGGITIAQLARRVANLEAIVARGEAFIQPKERPAVGLKAKKRGR
ncbi:MAG TPA: hypothetical protein VN881_14045 [Candidatus Acidoferrales bacterium]|nr:hypothetical protein [Candidatus Acidoferrales bacterium]